VVFVSTSRVLERFRNYAPGLDVATSRCAVHALDARSGALLGRLEWPAGDQVFALDWVDAAFSTGLPYRYAKGARDDASPIFYLFDVTSRPRRS
jgi:hypothetical protein